MTAENEQKEIDDFIRQSRELIGRPVQCTAWNIEAGLDAIRHFAMGISDDNPLWLDPTYAARSPFGQVVAPPTFLTSVCYPFLHGAPLKVPLPNLINALEFRWFRPILSAARLQGVSYCEDVIPSVDREGRRLVYLVTRTRYTDGDGNLVAEAKGTLARVQRQEGELFNNRRPSSYSTKDISVIHEAIYAEQRTGSRLLSGGDVQVGLSLPPIVRGPLTIGDLVCWYAGVGPNYRPGALGYRDRAKFPHTTTVIPGMGWPVSTAQTHVDPNLSSHRGLPAPFDNGVMRFSWASVLLTNWLGDHGFLQRMELEILAPLIYGDVTWYTAEVTAKNSLPTGDLITVQVSGKNQLGETTTRGEAAILLPGTPAKSLFVTVSDGWMTPRFIQQTIMQRAAETPGKLALTDGRQTLTFREMQQQAAQLANYLRSQGLVEGAHAGIFLTRSPRSVVAILAVLQAGAAFVPLDNRLPRARLAATCDDLSLQLILTESSLLGSLPARHAATALDLDTITAEWAHAPTSPPAVNLHGDSLAYIMVTSGSSGEPKGVMVPHRSLDRYLQALTSMEPMQHDDVYLHTASFSFSAAIRQLFFPLVNGVTLALAPENARRDPAALFEFMNEQGVTIWDTTPTFWQAANERLLASQSTGGRTSPPEKLRLILSTGEPLDWGTAKAWRHRLGHRAEIINLYSQTETCGTTAFYRLPGEFSDLTGIVPLGEPLDGVQIFVLDEIQRPLEPGEIGELYIGGERLSTGYWNKPEETQLSYLPNPYDPRGSIYFRSGDLASIDKNGRIAGHGRSDRRVKIRGYRVELGAIESILQQHSAVSQAVLLALAARETPDMLRLHAFVLPVDLLSPPDENELRQFAADNLPEYMIPATFTVLDKLPLTTSGKTDRRTLALQVQTISVPEPASERRPEDIEARMLALWARFFEGIRVDLDDSFFNIGGDSLLAVRLLAAVEEEYQVNLPLSALLESPTPRSLVQAVLSSSSAESSSAVVSLQSQGSRLPIFLIHGITGDVLWFRDLAQAIDTDQPLYGIQSPALDGHTAPFSTIESMAEAYIALIKSVQGSGPYLVGGASFGGRVALEIAGQLTAAGDLVDSLLLFDSTPPGYSDDSQWRRNNIGPFISNVPSWLRVNARLEPIVMFRRARRKSRLALSHALQLAGRQPNEDAPVAADVLDYADQLPAYRRQVVDANLRAAVSYEPRPYAGRTIYFRAQSRPLFQPRSPVDRWRDIAGNEFIEIPIASNHEGMFHHPHVTQLAEHLNRLSSGAI